MLRSSGSLFFKGVSTDGKQDITRITCAYRTHRVLEPFTYLKHIWMCRSSHLSCFFITFLFAWLFFPPFKDLAIKTAQSESELWETKVVSIFTTELSDMDLGEGNEGSLKAITTSEWKQQKYDTLPPFKPLLSIKTKSPPMLCPVFNSRLVVAVWHRLNEPCRTLRRVVSTKLEVQRFLFIHRTSKLNFERLLLVYYISHTQTGTLYWCAL